MRHRRNAKAHAAEIECIDNPRPNEEPRHVAKNR